MSLDKPLVSVITPCYNGEKCISRLIESILNQTYSNIEFIIINDGSTDDSERIILSYEQAFIDKGIIFKYIKQENKGLGGAINSGLKVFTSDFICWPDADDYLELNSIEERVNFLLQYPQYAVVTSNAYVRKADNLDNCRLLVSSNNTNVVKEEQFMLLLDGHGPFCSGCHMARASMFLDVNPDRSIYPARRGQNWQLLLPLYYKYKRSFLDKPLYNYIDNPGSMSKDVSFDNEKFRTYEHEKIINNTLDMIEKVQNVNLSKEKQHIKERYINERLNIAINYDNRCLYIEQYKEKLPFGVTISEKFTYLRMRIGIIYWINRFYKKLRFKVYKLLRG